METLSQTDVGPRTRTVQMMYYESWRVPLSSIIVVFIFILLSALNAPKPLHLDNVDFPSAAQKTAETGRPIYYRGENEAIAYALYHPPLYVYTLAAWMRLFGSTETSVRLFGMLCALLQGLVVFQILRCLFGPKIWENYAPWFWAVFLLNPYAVQTAGIADIDSTVYGPLLCLALLVVIQMNWEDGVWRSTQPRLRNYAYLSLVLTVCLWAKLTTVFLVFPFLFIFLLHRLGLWRSLAATLAITVVSCSTFYVTYWLFGKVTGLNINFTYAFTWMSFMKRGTSDTPGLAARLTDFQKNLKAMVPFMIAWTGLLPWIAAVCALIWAGVRAVSFKDRRALHYGTLLVLALLTIVYYCAKLISFGGAPFRYTFVYWALLLTAPFVLLTGDETAPPSNLVRTLRTRVLILASLAVLVAISFLVGARRVGDAFIILPQTAFDSPWIYLPALLLCLAVIGLYFRTPYCRLLMLAGFAISIGFQSGVALFQSRADYSTTYDYGQTGFLDTVGFIRAETKPNDIIVSMKDIAYKAERRYIENYLALYGYTIEDYERHDMHEPADEHVIHSIAEGKVRYAVFTEGHGQDQLFVNQKLYKWIRANCTMVRAFGDYRIYQYTGDDSSVKK